MWLRYVHYDSQKLLTLAWENCATFVSYIMYVLILTAALPGNSELCFHKCPQVLLCCHALFCNQKQNAIWIWWNKRSLKSNLIFTPLFCQMFFIQIELWYFHLRNKHVFQLLITRDPFSPLLFAIHSWKEKKNIIKYIFSCLEIVPFLRECGWAFSYVSYIILKEWLLSEDYQ